MRRRRNFCNLTRPKLDRPIRRDRAGPIKVAISDVDNRRLMCLFPQNPANICWPFWTRQRSAHDPFSRSSPESRAYASPVRVKNNRHRGLVRCAGIYEGQDKSSYVETMFLRRSWRTGGALLHSRRRTKLQSGALQMEGRVPDAIEASQRSGRKREAFPVEAAKSSGPACCSRF